ncbi:30s ribosomal protein s14 [Cystoisospora suis]|uniref:30s ribosomal protein s14 n=1 Tax=Cystoisospora suis TaxID=483139 RepID=A0A2C6L2D9_9APIC|nr:30s ribosomal protein s14 [Cystoisospora suis]
MNLFPYGSPGDRDSGPLSSTSSALASTEETIFSVCRYTGGLPGSVKPFQCKGRKKTADYKCFSLLRHQPFLFLNVKGRLLFLSLVSVLFSSNTFLADSISLHESSACCRPCTGPVIHSAPHSRRPAEAGFSLTQGIFMLREGEFHPYWLPSCKLQQRLSIQPSKQQVGRWLPPSCRRAVAHSPTSPRGCPYTGKDTRSPQRNESDRQAQSAPLGATIWTRAGLACVGEYRVSLPAFLLRAASLPVRWTTQRRHGSQGRDKKTTSGMRKERESDEGKQTTTRLTMVKQRKYQLATDNIFIGLRDAQVQRNLRRKQMMIDYRPLRQYYKHKIDHATSVDEYLDWHRRLKKLPRDSSPTRYRNRCHVCGRARGYFRFFGLCRHHVLDMVRNAMLPGFTKAEW